jgi:hypothetical protein
MQALQQQLPVFSAREMSIPKVILFLTEQEYESLGIEFDVNQIYEIRLESQTLRFMKVG